MTTEQRRAWTRRDWIKAGVLAGAAAGVGALAGLGVYPTIFPPRDSGEARPRELPSTGQRDPAAGLFALLRRSRARPSNRHGPRPVHSSLLLSLMASRHEPAAGTRLRRLLARVCRVRPGPDR